MYSYNRSPYCGWIDEKDPAKQTDSPATYPEERIFNHFLMETFGSVDMCPVKVDGNTENRLMIHYLLEALLSRFF